MTLSRSAVVIGLWLVGVTLFAASCGEPQAPGTQQPSAAGAQYAKGFAKDLVLIRREVDDAIRNDHVD